MLSTFPVNPKESLHDWRGEAGRCPRDRPALYRWRTHEPGISPHRLRPNVKRDDVKCHGDYRTERTTRAIYGAMPTAIQPGRQYQTVLDPPAADVMLVAQIRSKAG